MDSSPAAPSALDVLQRSPLFSGLHAELLQQMASRFSPRRLEAGQGISPQALQDRLFVIESGRIRLGHSHPDNGRQLTLLLLEPGDVFDLLALLDPQPHGLEAFAREPALVWSVSMREARQWLADHPEFNRQLLPYLGALCRRLESLAEDLALHDTASRLARLILRHTTPAESRSKPAPTALPVRLIADLKHEELAQLLGSVRQVVNQHLQTLRRSGVLELEKGRMLVKNLTALEQQAGAALERLRHRSLTGDHRW